MVEVESSKSGDCPADSQATVQLADLQEMHNQFREQIDSGLQEPAEQAGLPTRRHPNVQCGRNRRSCPRCSVATYDTRNCRHES